MRALVVGAGAVGSWMGAALLAGGAGVTLVEPGPRRARIAADGVTLLSPRRGLLRVRPAVVACVADVPDPTAFDVAVVATRSTHTAAVAAELAAVGAPRRVLCIQNGIGNEEVLARALPGRTVLPASLTTGLLVAPDGAVHASAKGGVGVGASADRADVTDIVDALRAGGLVVRRYADGRAMKWSKLLLNLLGSATSAITGWPPARVFADRRLFDIECAAWREALAVMRALGLTPVGLPGYPVPLYAAALASLPPPLAFRVFAGRLAGARGDRLPGVAADLAAGRAQTENGVLTGAVVAHGDAAGVAVPVSRVLHDVVESIAAGRVERASYAGRPEALLGDLGWSSPPRAPARN